MNLNKIQIIGRLTKAPELRSLPSGVSVVTLSVATSYTYKDKEDQKQEKTTFHNVVAFGKQAEVINQYFIKGQEIYVEGRQENESYDKKDGSGKGYRSQIIVEKFEFGQKPKHAQDDFDQTAPEDDGNQDTGEDINPDDIPF